MLRGIYQNSGGRTRKQNGHYQSGGGLLPPDPRIYETVFEKTETINGSEAGYNFWELFNYTMNPSPKKYPRGRWKVTFSYIRDKNLSVPSHVYMGICATSGSAYTDNFIEGLIWATTTTELSVDNRDNDFPPQQTFYAPNSFGHTTWSGKKIPADTGTTGKLEVERVAQNDFDRFTMIYRIYEGFDTIPEVVYPMSDITATIKCEWMAWQ